jgi:hypothetical protein
MTEPAPKPLVSVERQVETDLATGATETRLFLKMYFEARDSGLLADIGDRRWRTLCCMATYMSEKGLCFPSQARIAKDLGIHRQRANERVQELLQYRFNGRPVLTLERRRVKTSAGERWGSNVYRVLPISGLGIFGSEPVSGSPDTSPVSEDPATGHGPVSGKPDTGNPDTNQIQINNKTHTVCDSNEGASALVAFFHEERGAPSRRATPRELGQARELLARVGAERAEFVVRFALAEARKTKFEMRHFGAVLGYEAEALLSQSRRSAAARNRQTSDSERSRKEKEAEFAARREAELDRLFDRLEDSQKERITAEATERVRADRGDHPLGFQTLTRIAIRAIVSDLLACRSSGAPSTPSRR